MKEAARAVGDQHDGIEAEFSQHLAATSAGRAAVVGDDGDGLEFHFAIRDGFVHGHALGAHGGGIGRVLHVDAGVDAARFRAERRADAIVRIWHVGASPRLVGKINQLMAFFVGDVHGSSLLIFDQNDAGILVGISYLYELNFH